ncbi:hypothetical protein [Microvirga solisilvae]|uniref:hypothetical protein n=1 Tax=Microvirga solisilvae TaxID=2919498 RepID=UPI001FAEB263|nr:hypothetical protein [Microvirga solisilvae]
MTTAPRKPCRCAERGAAATRFVREVKTGEMANAAKSAAFIVSSMIQDRGAIAQRIQSGAASLLRRVR